MNYTMYMTVVLILTGTAYLINLFLSAIMDVEEI